MDTTDDAVTVSMGMPALQSTISANARANVGESLDKSTSSVKSRTRSRKSTKMPTTNCPDCGIIVTKHGLNRHRSEQHQGDMFKCSLCEFTAKRKLYLKEHITRIHLEPTVLGRPKKNKKSNEKRKRTRSPFRVNKFEKRHKSSLTMIEKNVQKDIEHSEQLKQIKEKLAETEAEKASENLKMEQRLLERLNQSYDTLAESKKKADIEFDKIRTRVTMMESKQAERQLPDVNNIPALLQYLNMKQTCTKKDIDTTINLRLMESSAESTVSDDIFVLSDMTEQKREKLVMFYNEASDKLQKWRKQRDLRQKTGQSIITID